MVELDVKITSGDLYDFLLRHSYNSVSGLLGAVIGALSGDPVISPLDAFYQK